MITRKVIIKICIIGDNEKYGPNLNPNNSPSNKQFKYPLTISWKIEDLEKRDQLRAFAVLPEKLNLVHRNQVDPFTTNLPFTSVYCKYHCLMKV